MWLTVSITAPARWGLIRQKRTSSWYGFSSVIRTARRKSQRKGTWETTAAT